MLNGREGAGSSGATPTGEGAQGLPDRVLSLLGVGLLLAALVIAATALLRRTPASGSNPTAIAAATPLRILAPTDGAEMVGPVPLLFTSRSPLGRTPMGWGTGALHLHAAVNGQDLMPAPNEIARAGSDRYRWTLALPPGEHEVRLFWSGADHRPLASGASSPVRLQVRNPDR